VIPDIQDVDFDTYVEKSEIPVLVEFWQPGCYHCQALLLQLDQVQVALETRIHIVKMNVQENFQIPADLEVQSLPSLALFYRGDFVQFVGGIGTAPELIAQLTQWLQRLDDKP